MSYHNITTNQNQDHRDGVMSPRTNIESSSQPGTKNTYLTIGINGMNGIQGTNPRPNGEKPDHPGLKKEEVPALNKEIITHQSIAKDGEINQNIVTDVERISVPNWNHIRYDIPNPPTPIDTTNDRTLAQIFFNPLNMAMPEELKENVDIASTTKYTIDELELTLLGTFNIAQKNLRAIVKFPLDENIVVAVDQHIKHIYFLNKDGILDKYLLYGMDFSTLTIFLRKIFDIGNVYVHQDFNAIIHRIIMGRQNRIRYAIYEDELPKTEDSKISQLLAKNK